MSSVHVFAGASGRGRAFVLGLTALVLAVNIGAGSAAHAAPAGERRLGVLKFRGPAEGLSRASVVRAAKANHLQVIGDKQLEKTAKRLRVRLDSNAGFEAVARALGVAAFVTGELTHRKATLAIRSGDGGGVVEEAAFTGADPRKLAAAVGRTFWKRLGPAIDRASAPRDAKHDVAAEDEAVAETDETAGTEEAPSPEDSGALGDRGSGRSPHPATPANRTAAPRTEAEPEAEDANGPAAPPPKPARAARARDAAKSESAIEALDEALSVAVGPRYGMRSLSYTDDRYAMNSRYALAQSPLAGVDFDFFPGALFSSGAAGSIGLTGSFQYQLPVVQSQFREGGPIYSTRSLAGSFGLKIRLPAGLFLTGAVGNHYFELLQGASAVPSDVPMTNYQFVRGGAGLRARMSPSVRFMAHGAYLHCLKVGQIGGAGYYPRATAAGFEAGVAFGFLMTPSLELRLGVDVQRFGLKFHVTVQDYMNGARTAGGAIDQYSEAWIALAWVLGPAPRPSTEEAHSEAGGSGKSGS